MAKLVETNLDVKISKLYKDNESKEELITENFIEQLEDVVSEMIGDGRIMVEVYNKSTNSPEVDSEE